MERLIALACAFLLAAPIAATQYARPSSDDAVTYICASAGWSDSPADGTFYHDIDETVASDGDYIYSTLGDTACGVVLSSVTDPVSSSSHVIRFRAKKVDTAVLTVALVEGTTTRASYNPTLTTSYAEYTYTLSAAEADAITSYASLKLVFTPSGGGGRYDEAHVSYAVFEVPDVSAARRIAVVH